MFTVTEAGVKGDFQTFPAVLVVTKEVVFVPKPNQKIGRVKNRKLKLSKN